MKTTQTTIGAAPDTAPNRAMDIANQLHRSTLHLLRLLNTGRPTKKLNSSQLGVLGRLYRDGQATATELAGYLRVKPQSLTRLLAGLEQDRLITREPDQADHRQSLVQITDRGIELLIEEIGQQRLDLAQIIERVLTPSEQQILRLAAGLMDELAAALESRAAAETESGQK